MRRLAGHPRFEWKKCCVARRERRQSSLPDSGARESLPEVICGAANHAAVCMRLSPQARKEGLALPDFSQARAIRPSTCVTCVDANACR